MSWIDDQRPDDAMAGAFEAIGPEPVVTVEAAVFRDAMCRLGAAVHVVTTAGSGGKTGFTATAVCSVSDAPPTLLVCLNRKSQGGPILRENKVFCVNTLGADCEDVADVFAGRTGAVKTERFATGLWSTLKTGAPVLASSVVAFRLPGDRNQGGGKPQCHLRRRRGYQAGCRRAGAGLPQSCL